MVDGAVVHDGMVGLIGLLLLRQLPSVALGHGGVAASRGPRGAQLLGSDHGDRRVEDRRHPCLEQQRGLDDRCAWRSISAEPELGVGSFTELVHALADQRPDHALQPRPLLGCGEDALSDHRAIDVPFSMENAVSPSLHDQRAKRLTAVELVDDGVGRDHGRAQLTEQRQRSRFACAEPAREPDEGDGAATCGGAGSHGCLGLFGRSVGLGGRLLGCLGSRLLCGSLLSRSLVSRGFLGRGVAHDLDLGLGRRLTGLLVERDDVALDELGDADGDGLIGVRLHVVGSVVALVGDLVVVVERAGREDLALDSLHRQREAATLVVDLEDLDLDGIAGCDDLTRVLDVMAGQLGDVDEALDAVEDLDERTEGDDLRDDTLELVAHVVRVDDALPRIFLGLFETKGDALTLAVDVEHLDLHRLTDGEQLGRVVDVRPGQLGDVDETVDAGEIDKRAEVDDVRDLTLHDVAGVQAVEDLLTLLLALLFEDRAAREHDVVALTVELDDPALDGGAHELVEVRDAADVDQGGRQEAADTQIQDQAALDDLDHVALDGLAGLGGSLDATPCLLEARTLLRHDESAVLVLLDEDEGIHLFAELDLFGGSDRLADGQLVRGDDALGLVADVDENLVVVDADDLAGDDVTLLEGSDGRVVVGNNPAVDLEQQAVAARDDRGVRGRRFNGLGHELPRVAHAGTPAGCGHAQQTRSFSGVSERVPQTTDRTVSNSPIHTRAGTSVGPALPGIAHANPEEVRGVPPTDPQPASQPDGLRLPPERSLSLALGADGRVRAVIGMPNDEPVLVPVGAPIAELLPDGGTNPWPRRLAELAADPVTSLRFEVPVQAGPDRAHAHPLRRVVRAVPVPGADGRLESILLRLAVAHEVGGLPDPGEERFRFLAETLPQMLWIARPDGTTEYLSPQWEAFSGVPVSQLLTDGYHSIIHPDDLSTLGAVETDTGDFLMTPFRLRRADGAYRWVEATIRPVRDGSGKLVRTVGTTTDVTPRREADDERQVLTEQLRAALSVSGMARYEFDLSTGVVTGDRRLAELLYVSTDEDAGPSYSLDEGLSRVHPEDRDRVARAIEAAIRGNDLHVEYRVVDPDSDDPPVRWVSARGRVEKVDGHPVRLIGVVGDETDRRAEDAARLRSQKREAIGTLAGGIAHDFNNVISAIWSNASVAETELRAGVSPETSIAEIKRGAERAADVVKRLLSFSREDKPERVPFDLVDVAREACELLRPTLAAGVSLEAPRDAVVHAVLGSASQLHQVVVNLVANAGHAAADGGGHVWVTVDEIRNGPPSSLDGPAAAALPAGDYVRLRVRDDGPGIPAAVMPRIFDPFFTTKAIGDGTGLGLAAAHSIVRAHGGDIWADDEASTGGAVFTVLLPASDRALPQRDDDRDHRADPPANVTPQVLYVDDDPALAKLAARALPLHGCGVSVHTDATEALAALRANPDRFDAVVLDLAMPGLSGFDLVEEARQLRPDLVLIISSGLVSGDQRERATRLGVGAILPKPVSIESIAETVKELTARVRAGHGPTAAS